MKKALHLKSDFLPRTLLVFLLCSVSLIATARVYDGNEKIYLRPSAVSWWLDANAKIGMKFSNGTANEWVEILWLVDNEGGNIWSASVPAGDWTTVKVTRHSASPINDGNIWNQTGDIIIDAAKNYIYSFENGTSTATWQTLKAHYRSKTTGNWSAVTTWIASFDTNWTNSWDYFDAHVVPNANDLSVTIMDTHNVTLNDNVGVNSLTVNIGATFTASDETAQTLTIADNGQLTNHGTFTRGGGTVNFAGTGTVSGTVDFNNVILNGGVDFGNASTINGYLNLRVGAYIQTNAPSYATGSQLKYNTGTQYGVYLEWADNKTSDSGVPYDVIIGDEVSSSGLTFLSGDRYRYMAGDLTISSGATLILSSANGGDLKLGGNFTNNGTFNPNNRAVFFDGTSLQTIASTGMIEIPYLLVNNLTDGVKINAPLTSINIENNGKLTIASGITVLTSGTISGSGTTYVEQTLPSGRQWWYLASPLSGATSNVIRPDGSANLMTHYDEAAFNYSTAYAANSATPLVAGRGYVVKFSDANERTVVFTGGSLNNGEVALTPTRTGTTAGKRGFNLIGNPYPSYLNWDAVYTDATNPAVNMRNAIWFRTMDGVMKFHTYSDGEGVPSLDANDNPLTITGQIAPMQAFWVKVQADPLAPETVSNGSLTFKNTHRSHQAATGYNPLKAKAAELRPRVRLVISNGVADDEMLVVGKSYAANGLDSYDIEKMSNDNAAIPELFSLVENQELVINSMQELKAGKWVMLGMRPGVAGNFGIKVSQLENIDAQVMLIDRLLNTEQELTLGETYSFTSDGTATNDRFSLEFRAPGTITSVDELATEAHVFVNENRQLIVQAPGITRNDRISVYTLAGQQLQLQQADGAVTVLSRPLTTGVYIVKVNQLVEKVIVK